MNEVLDVRLRRLGSGDIDRALAYVRAYYAHDGLTFDAEVALAVQELLEVPDFGLFFAIDDAGAEGGYIVLTYGFDHEYGGRLGWITDFYLEPDFRSRGIGSHVMRLVVDEAKSRGLRRVELLVLAHNPSGRRFYERAGFNPVEGRQTMALSL